MCGFLTPGVTNGESLNVGCGGSRREQGHLRSSSVPRPQDCCEGEEREGEGD